MTLNWMISDGFLFSTVKPVGKPEPINNENERKG